MENIQIINSKKKPKKSILDLPSTDWGTGTEHISEDPDSVLYDEPYE